MKKFSSNVRRFLFNIFGSIVSQFGRFSLWLKEVPGRIAKTWGVIALIFNSIVAIIAFGGLSPVFSNYLVCYLVFIFSIIAAFSTLLAMYSGEIGRLKTLIFLGAHSVALIFLFAGISYSYGLVGSGVPMDGGEGAGGMDRISALYFAIVTWTTLGYGDFSPKPELRLLASFIASTGYLFLGLIVATVSSALVDRSVSKNATRGQQGNR